MLTFDNPHAAARRDGSRERLERLEPASGQGISRALRLARRTRHSVGTPARALGPGLPDPKGKVNGDADCGRERTLNVVSGFRAQGSKQGRACCAAELVPSLKGASVAQIDATFGHLVPDSDAAPSNRPSGRCSRSGQAPPGGRKGDTLGGAFWLRILARQASAARRVRL